MRVPWGEGNGSGGVSARGSCQGGGPSCALRTGPSRASATVMDGKGVWVPGGLVADDGVEDGEELVHAGDECDLLGFALGYQPVVEGPDDRIGAQGRDGGRGRCASPPQQDLGPWRRPLSWARGARPTNAAMGPTPPTRAGVRLRVGPTPGTERRSCSRCCQWGDWPTRQVISRSRSANSAFRTATIRSMRDTTTERAMWRRWSSAVRDHLTTAGSQGRGRGLPRRWAVGG